MANKKFKCPYCKLNYLAENAVYNHMEKEHNDQLFNLPAQQIYFNFKNRYSLNKEFGKCVMTGKPTKFNILTGKYERFADENARKAYREYFRKNMIKVFGKDTILDEPEQQKKMLANRSISGVYEWLNGEKTTFTGTYERSFLEYLDLTLNWENPGDVLSPAPMTFPYKDSEGIQHFHIPDFYISSMNLIINIKASDNQHYRLRDIETEKYQDLAIKTSKFNYLKLYDNNFDKFLEIMDMIKEEKEDSKKRIFLENIQLGQS
jgi:hypothetical protein